MRYGALLILAGGLLAREASARLERCEITNPAEGTLYDPGQRIDLAGGCTDSDGVAMPDSLLTWMVEYRLDGAATAQMADTRGSSSGTFTTRSQEDAGTAWYRIRLRGGSAADTSVRGVRDILPRSGKAVQVYLSDLDWSDLGNGWGPVEKDQSNGEADVNDGRTISIRYQNYPKGFGVHAPSEILVPVHGQCLSLMAEVGADDEVNGGGSVTFQVIGDGATLSETPVLHGEDPLRLMEVDISGKQDLHLVVTDGKDGIEADHASWGGARAICKEGFAPPASNLKRATTAAESKGDYLEATWAGPGSGLDFRFNLDRTTEVTLELQDARGRLLAESERRSLPGGSQSWNWSPGFNRAGSGILFAIVKTGRAMRVKKIASIAY